MAKSSEKPVTQFWKLMRPEAPEIRLIFLFSIVTGAMSLALPLAFNSFINTLSFGIQTLPFMQMLFVLLGTLLVCLTVAGLFTLLQYFLSELIQRRLFVRLAADLAERLPRINLSAFGRRDGPELVNRFFEIVMIQKTTSILFLQGLNLILTSIVGLIILSFYHPFLFGFVLATSVAMLGIVFIAGRGGIQTAVDESDAKYKVIGWMEQMAGFPRTFKFGRARQYAIQRTDSAVEAYLHHRKRHFRILIRQIGLLISVEVIASVALLGIGGQLVLAQQLTLGQLVAAELILASILSSVSKLGKQFEAWYDSMAAMNKLGYLIGIKTERKGGDAVQISGNEPYLIEAEKVEYHFTDGAAAFQPVNLQIRPGTKHAIHAGDGDGQSSFMDLLAGLKNASSGTLKIYGRRVETWNLASLHEQVMLLRERQIFEGTLRENLSFGSIDIQFKDLEDAMERVGLSRIIERLPLGLETRLLPNGDNISSGERARILIARALVQKPKLLIIDDTLEKLSPEDRYALATEIVKEPWTVVFGTQDRSVQSLCEEIHYLSRP